MASSTSGKGRQQTPAGSSANGLKNLLANEMQDVDQLEAISRQTQKLEAANTARLMLDNQQVLDTSTAEDRALRQQRHRFRELQLRKMQAELDGSRINFPEDNMGDINIDSPTEVHHHYPAPPSTGLGTAAKAALATAAILAGTLGGAGLGYLLMPKPVAPVNTTIEKHEGFDIRLVEPNGGKKP